MFAQAAEQAQLQVARVATRPQRQEAYVPRRASAIGYAKVCLRVNVGDREHQQYHFVSETLMQRRGELWRTQKKAPGGKITSISARSS